MFCKKVKVSRKVKITKLKKGKVFKVPSKVKIKKGDLVEVISGDYKKKRGIILKMMPKIGKALVEGINMKVKHIKPNAEASKKGYKKDIEGPISVCKLMFVDPKTNEKTKIGRKLNDNNKLNRYSKKTGQFI